MRKERDDYEEQIKNLSRANQDQAATIQGLLQRLEELQMQLEMGRAREQTLESQVQGLVPVLVVCFILCVI